MFWFKVWHRLKSCLRRRKLKFTSDESEMAWLKAQGTDERGVSEDRLTPEQRARWAELTDRPFPDHGRAVK